MTKVTFTLDADTVEAIAAIAMRRRTPKSQVIREAVAAFAEAELTLDSAERARRLRVLDEVAARPRSRPQVDVDREITAIRRARRTGWRRQPE